MDETQLAVDHLYKEHFGKLIASLLYSSRDIDPETAEDLVQDSFASALKDWPVNGIPSNPAGWIYKVCKNKAINKIKKDQRKGNLSEVINIESISVKFTESVLHDHHLILLFACAHPDLAPKVQVVITLKYVVNLKVEAIAKILGMTIDGVDKLLLRARQKIKNEKILLEEPSASALRSRLSIVHKILYLIFNEGYKASWGKELIREELCEEALMMTHILIDSDLGDSETKALYALMLFNSARFKSRFDSSGQLLDLEKQNRSLWNTELILLAADYLQRSRGEHLSSYHLEASIAFLHCTAKSFESTEWKTITQLYEKLLFDNANPFVQLNYAVALYYAGQKEKAFGILNELHGHPFLNQYYLLNATLGKLHQLEGNDSLARKFLADAHRQTDFDLEKRFIQKLMDDLQ
jgi:RNA polymerase sigma factor (sigma-70 family)